MIYSTSYTSCFNHSTSFASALPRCEISFFSALGISAYVWPSYSKQASQPKTIICQPLFHARIMVAWKDTDSPKLVGPLADTILPCSEKCQEEFTRHGVVYWQMQRLTSVLPWKTIGSAPGPSQYAKVHTACADLSTKPASSLWNCCTPRAWRNHFLCTTSVVQSTRGTVGM